MKLKDRLTPPWDIRVINPNTLSDEQAAYFYAQARKDCSDVPSFPPGSMGQLATAAWYVRFRQKQLGKLTLVPHPDF